MQDDRKLYIAHYEVDMAIVASSKEEAQEIAEENARDAFFDRSLYPADTVTVANYLPSEYGSDDLPWGDAEVEGEEKSAWFWLTKTLRLK